MTPDVFEEALAVHIQNLLDDGMTEEEIRELLK